MTLRAVPDSNNAGKRYIEDDIDQKHNIHRGCQISIDFGNILGGVRLCITYFEEGIAISYTKLIERYIT